MIQHGVSFGDVHSFYDLDLILAAVNISPASPKEAYIDIPGADGSLDMTEALGEVKYKDRTATFTFFMNPGSDLSEAAWEEKKMAVCNRLNGIRCNITLDKDPDYFWQGRCRVNEHTSAKKLRKFVVAASVAPYKLKKDETVYSVSLSESPSELKLTNGRKTVCPVFECTGAAVLVIGDDTFNISEGTHKVLDIQLHEGTTTVTVSGTGTLNIKYQEGEL